MSIMSLKQMYERAWDLMHATPSQDLTHNIIADIDDYLGPDQKLINTAGLGAVRTENEGQKIYLVRCANLNTRFVETGYASRTLYDIGFDRVYIFTCVNEESSVVDMINLFTEIIDTLIAASSHEVDYDTKYHSMVAWLIWKMSKELICKSQETKYDLYSSEIAQRVYEDFKYTLQYIDHFLLDPEKYPNVTDNRINCEVVNQILANTRVWADHDDGPTVAQVSGCFARFQYRWDREH